MTRFPGPRFDPAGVAIRAIARILPIVMMWVAGAAGDASAAAPERTLPTRVQAYAPGTQPGPYTIRGVIFAYAWGNTRISQPSWKDIAAAVDSQAARLGADMVIGLVTGDKDERYDVFKKWAIGLAALSGRAPGKPGPTYDPRLVWWRQPRFADDAFRSAKNRQKLDERSSRIARLALAAKGYYLTESETVAQQMFAAQFGPDSAADGTGAGTRPLWLQLETIEPGTRFRARVGRGAGGPATWESSDSSAAVGADFASRFFFGGGAAMAEVVDVLFSHLPTPAALRDTDRDGVPDYRDRQPETPEGAEVDAVGAARDSDADGVPDGIDLHARTPRRARVDVRGRPLDADHDGIFDGIDNCADTPADFKVDSTGCPVEVTEIEERLLDVGRIVEQHILFETGRADLLTESSQRLDRIGEALSDLPTIRFEVAGHCDERGSDESNQVLSEARADAVVGYLARKFPGLRPEQMLARGYGKSRPLVPGATPGALAQNRRVEFVVLNRDELKSQIERRRFLRRGETPAAEPGTGP